MSKLKTPTYHRQRFLLTLLDSAGGKLSKMDLQKLLFLSQHEANFDYYDFVPYHYGCYSFQAQSDISLLQKLGWLTESKQTISLNQQPGDLVTQDRLQVIQQWLSGLKGIRGKRLVRYVYTRYPYYATNSRIAEDVLSTVDMAAVTDAHKQLSRTDKTVFTLGYEGLTFEAYVNRLIHQDIRLLVDVRKNPLSRKFGFSKGTLSQILPKLGIKYVHIPDLGIQSDLRRDLDSAADYQALFTDYRKGLPEHTDSLSQLEDLVSSYHRIALTCFEKKHTSCHRHCVSDFLEKERNLKVCHL